MKKLIILIKITQINLKWKSKNKNDNNFNQYFIIKKIFLYIVEQIYIFKDKEKLKYIKLFWIKKIFILKKNVPMIL